MIKWKYRRAFLTPRVSNPRRFVDWDPSKLTDKDLQFIGTNLKFARKFVRMYPNAISRKFPIISQGHKKADYCGKPLLTWKGAIKGDCNKKTFKKGL